MLISELVKQASYEGSLTAALHQVLLYELAARHREIPGHAPDEKLHKCTAA